MNKKGVDTCNKDILITNGFTEGLDIILSSFTSPGDYNNLWKSNSQHIYKDYEALGLNLIGVDIDEKWI